MRGPGVQVTRTALLWGAMIVIGTAVRWPSMSYALTEAYAFRQTQTALMIREYMEGGLFQLSPLPLFGPPWQVPLEFPLFQWSSAVLGQTVGASPQIAGRLMALLMFQACAVVAGYLAWRWFSPAAGAITVLLFQATPFGYQWGNAPLIEFMAVLGALVMIAAVDRWSGGWGWLAVASAGALVVFLVKPTTAVVWMPLYVALAVVWTRTGFWRATLQRWPLVIPPVLGLVAAGVWTLLADRVKSENPFTQFLTSGELTSWYYGSVDQRLSADTWGLILGYSESIIGSLVIFGALAIAAFAVWPRRAVLAGLALALPTGALVFTNLYYMHAYYQAAVFPALCLVVAAGIAALARLIRGLPAKVGVATTAALVVIISAWLSGEGQLASERRVGGLYEFPLAAEIAAIVPPGEGVVVVDCDWDPAYLYLSGKKGLMIRAEDLATAIPPEWFEQDLRYVAWCGPNAASATGWPEGVRLERVTDSIYRVVP